MPDTGFVLCTATSIIDIGAVNWTNPGNVTADDGSNASTSPGASADSDFLCAITYGLALPTGATVNGIEFQLDRNYSGTLVSNIFATKDGASLAGSGKNGAGGSGLETLGGAADLWGTTWTEAEVEAAEFGVAISFNGGGSGGTATLDAVWAKVYYTEPGLRTIRRPAIVI